MNRQHLNRYDRHAQRGLTLLELLVVLGIIAAVAGIGVQVYTGINDNTEENLVRTEMREVASAMQRFRSDSGYWPKQGPFANAFDDVDGDADNDIINPANLLQLFEQPVDNGGTAILAFDAASGTGWNGPYLTELDAVRVNTGEDLAASGTGNPTTGDVEAVRGIGDTFAAAPTGAIYQWVNSAGVATVQLGRPYFYFLDGSSVTGCTAPCLLSAGPDGVYNQGSGDDIVINIGALN